MWDAAVGQADQEAEDMEEVRSGLVVPLHSLRQQPKVPGSPAAYQHMLLLSVEPLL